MCAAFAAAGTLLSAAENVNYTWCLQNAEGVRGWQKEAPTAEKPLTFKKDPKSKWGARIQVKLDKAEPGVFYRITFNSKTENPKGTYFFIHPTLGYCSGGPANRGNSTFFIQTDSAERNRWEVGFDGDFGNLTVSALRIEKLSADEMYQNVIPNDGLEPGFWRRFWGGPKDVVGTLKKSDNSPNGNALAFPAAQPDTGTTAVMPLPFIPNQKFEISFWLRSDTASAPIMFQVLSSNISHNRIGLKKEWTEYKFTGITKEKPQYGGLIPTFYTFGKTNTLPAFELGGIDFHYVK